MSAYLFLCLIALYSVCAKDVISVTDKTWKQEVVESPLPVFVKFYAPWCGHCKSLAPTWEKIATNLKGLVKVVHVDCTVEQALCQKFQIQGYPTLKLFKDNGKAVDYQQGRDAATLVKFATDQIPNNVVQIKNEDGLASFLAKSESLPHVILFSQKKDIPALYKALSAVFKGKLVLGQVASSVSSAVEKYGPFEAFPKIVVIPASGEKQIYDGAISVSALREYLAQFAGEEPTTTTEDAPKPKPPAPKPEPAKWTKANAENVDTECGKLCVVAFVSEEPTADDQKVLDSILHKFKSDKKFKFLLASTAEKALVEKFKASSSSSSLVVYNTKRQRAAKASEFDLETITQLMERVIGGDATYHDL